jgi:hypothetical protein
MYTYQNFIQQKDRLTFQEAGEIYEQLVQNAAHDDPDFEEYWHDMIKSANIYTNTRANWLLLDHEERRDMDLTRIHQHDEFMENLAVIARYLKRHNLNTDWYERLGNPERDRKRFGDFACYITYVYSLNAR